MSRFEGAALLVMSSAGDARTTSNFSAGFALWSTCRRITGCRPAIGIHQRIEMAGACGAHGIMFSIAMVGCSGVASRRRWYRHLRQSGQTRRKAVQCRRSAVLASVTGGALSYIEKLTASAAPVHGCGKQLWLVEKSTAGFPELVPKGCNFSLSELRNIDVAVLGEHHNWLADHRLQGQFLKDFASAHGSEKVVLGLEMVEQPFQPQLDRFNNGSMSVMELFEATEWADRWGWSFKKYAPLLEAARHNRVPLVALNVSSEVQHRVQMSGLDVLTAQEREQYMPDAKGFAQSQMPPGFHSYVDQLVMPPYEAMLLSGALQSRDPRKATRGNFEALRLLRDEAMSAACLRSVLGHDSSLSRGLAKRMVIAVGNTHVAYEYGVAQRLRRARSGGAEEGDRIRVATVLLNPAPEDTLSQSDDLQLVLPLDGTPQSVWPKLADYVWSTV